MGGNGDEGGGIGPPRNDDGGITFIRPSLLSYIHYISIFFFIHPPTAAATCSLFSSALEKKKKFCHTHSPVCQSTNSGMKWMFKFFRFVCAFTSIGIS